MSEILQFPEIQTVISASGTHWENDEILLSLRHSLSLHNTEYRGTEEAFVQIQARRNYLEKAREDTKKMIAEREELLKHLSSTRNKSESNSEDVKKFDSGSSANFDVENYGKEKPNPTEDNTAPAVEENKKSTLEITPRMFTDMSLIKATIKFLRLVKMPQTTRQIADALLLGGYKTVARDFPDTVRGTLKQYKHPAGEMLWSDNKWELKEWHPESE